MGGRAPNCPPAENLPPVKARIMKLRPTRWTPLYAGTRIVACTLLCMGLHAPLLAQGSAPSAPVPIDYASPDQSVWTTRLRDNGEPDNPLLPVASALFSKAAIPWRAKSYPASRMFNYLQDGTVQFSMLVKAPSLQACCLFSRKPVVTAEIRAYRRVGTAPAKTREDLIGKQVITIRGYSYGGLAPYLGDPLNRITVHETQAHASAFKMLANARADYLLDYAGPAGEVLAAEPIGGIAYDVLSRQDVYLILSKSYPNAAQVMQRLEAIMATLDVEALMGRAHSPRK